MVPVKGPFFLLLNFALLVSISMCSNILGAVIYLFSEVVSAAALGNSTQFNTVDGKSALAVVLRSKEFRGVDFPE